MNIIKRVIIQNFQSHKRTVIPFVPGVNAIIGISNHGKSAILRALRLAIYNQPAGTEYRSNWGGDSSVRVQFNDGEVKRTRTDSENSYTLIKNNDKLNAEKFMSFNQSVPVPASEFINMEEVNFQAQLDPHFLLSDKDGEVAKVLNKVADLSIIDTSTAFINKELSRARLTLSAQQSQLVLLESKINQFNYLDEVNLLIEEVSSLNKQLQDKTEELEKINKIKIRCEELKEDIEAAELITNQTWFLFEQCSEKMRSLFSIKKDSILISRTITKIKDIEKELETEVDYQEALTLVNTGEVEIKKAKNLYKDQTRISSITKRSSQILTKISNLEKELAVKEGLFKKKMPKQCPLCGK